MPQNTKDSKGGKNKPEKDTSTNGGKQSVKEPASKKSGSASGATNKGEKKTTP